MGDNRSALLYYTNVVDEYHDTQYAPLAMYDKINMLVSLNRDNEALEAISKYLDRYPDNNRVKELQELKASLEVKLSSSK